MSQFFSLFSSATEILTVYYFSVVIVESGNISSIAKRTLTLEIVGLKDWDTKLVSQAELDKVSLKNFIDNNGISSIVLEKKIFYWLYLLWIKVLYNLAERLPKKVNTFYSKSNLLIMVGGLNCLLALFFDGFLYMYGSSKIRDYQNLSFSNYFFYINITFYILMFFLLNFSTWKINVKNVIIAIIYPVLIFFLYQYSGMTLLHKIDNYHAPFHMLLVLFLPFFIHYFSIWLIKVLRNLTFSQTLNKVNKYNAEVITRHQPPSNPITEPSTHFAS